MQVICGKLKIYKVTEIEIHTHTSTTRTDQARDASSLTEYIEHSRFLCELNQSSLMRRGCIVMNETNLGILSRDLNARNSIRLIKRKLEPYY